MRLQVSNFQIYQKTMLLITVDIERKAGLAHQLLIMMSVN
ncbi:hypothetical protein XNC3_2720004 [Xenorhabdus nematophila F1]|nr:hypothetical protein XNC3_2720004 [Xenorhabdus nematophila F1]